MPVPIAELFVTVGADVSGAVNSLNTLPGALQRVGAGLTRSGRALSLAITAPIVAGVGTVFKVGSDFDEAFTAVQKTVDNTDFGVLRTQLIDLSTSIEGGGKSAAELAQIAAVAGQLGIEGAPQLRAFTAAIAGLGVTTGLPVDQLADDVGRFLTLTHQAPEAAANFASALTALGNKMGGTEGDITQLARRLAGTLSSLGVDPRDILGISAALAEVGIRAEEGGTAISKFFVEMTAAANQSSDATSEAASKVRDLQDRILDLSGSLEVAVLRQKEFGRNTPASVVKANELAIAKYQREIDGANTKMSQVAKTGDETTLTLAGLAKVTGTSQSEFANLVNTDPAQAFTSVIKGLQRIRGEQGPAGVVSALDDLNIKEARLRETLLDLSASQDSLERGTTIANQAWNENTALSEEVTKAMSATNNQLKLMQNRLEAGILRDWDDFKTRMQGAIDFVNNSVVPGLEGLEAKWRSLSPAQQEAIIAFGGVAAALGPALLALGLMVGAIGALLSPIGLVLLAVAALATAWITNFGDIQGKTAAVVDFIKTHWLDMISAIPVIGPAIAGVITHFDSITAAVGRLWSVFLTVFTFIATVAERVFRQVGQWISENFTIQPLVDFLRFLGGIAERIGALATQGTWTDAFGGKDLNDLIRKGELALQGTSAGIAAGGPGTANNVIVNINNPALLDETMGERFAEQVQNAVINAMIEAESQSVVPPSPALPGVPF